MGCSSISKYLFYSGWREGGGIDRFHIHVQSDPCMFSIYFSYRVIVII